MRTLSNKTLILQQMMKFQKVTSGQNTRWLRRPSRGKDYVLNDQAYTLNNQSSVENEENASSEDVGGIAQYPDSEN